MLPMENMEDEEHDWIMVETGDDSLNSSFVEVYGRDDDEEQFSSQAASSCNGKEKRPRSVSLADSSEAVGENPPSTSSSSPRALDVPKQYLSDPQAALIEPSSGTSPEPNLSQDTAAARIALAKRGELKTSVLRSSLIYSTITRSLDPLKQSRPFEALSNPF